MKKSFMNTDQLDILNRKLRKDLYRLSRVLEIGKLGIIAVDYNFEVLDNILDGALNYFKTYNKEELYRYIIYKYLRYVNISEDLYIPRYLNEYNGYYIPSYKKGDVILGDTCTMDIVESMAKLNDNLDITEYCNIEIDKVLDITSYIKMIVSNESDLMELENDFEVLSNKPISNFIFTILSNEMIKGVLNKYSMLEDSKFCLQFNVLDSSKLLFGIKINDLFIEYKNLDLLDILEDYVLDNLDTNNNIIYVDFRKK